ncbi:MAG: serine/threonine-protein kinase [Myxococcota bacterium]
MAGSAMPTKRFGNYELSQCLGQGGMGEVYMAERIGEQGVRKRVALKRMRPEYAKNPVIVERFFTEVRTGARLEHPNIVQVFDFGSEPEPYLAMEYVEGVSLEALLIRLGQRQITLEVPAAVYIAVQVARAVDYAHRLEDEAKTPLGIVHRDISPANVLLSVEGTVKLGDFGLAQVADNRLEVYGAIPVGRVVYMAPEQLSGGHVDARADIFAFGIVFWEMLTGQRLITSNDPQSIYHYHRDQSPPPPSSVHSSVWPELDHIVEACCRFDSHARPPSAQSVVLALKEAEQHHGATYGPEQLARLVAWAFPERGWDKPHPDEPPAQPSFQERMSLAMAAPKQPTDQNKIIGLPPWAFWLVVVSGGVLFIAVVAFILGFISSAVL